VIARWRALIVLLLALAGAGLSGILLLDHHGETLTSDVANELCGEAGHSGCDTVSSSAYAEFRGFPVAAVGLLFYTAMGFAMLLALLSPPDVRDAAGWCALVATVVAVVVDLMLLGVQAFVIKAFCRMCLMTYVVSLAALVMLLPARRATVKIMSVLTQRDGRLALTGWLLASACLTAGVVAGETALDYRAARRQSALLGGPPPAAAPAPAAGGEPSPAPPSSSSAPSPAPASAAASPAPSAAPVSGPAGDLQFYKEQAERLQGILDDPQKLEKYFADKAAREFDQAPVQSLEIKGVPFKGPSDAPIRVVEFSDFLCPFCRSLAGAFSNYLRQPGVRVQIYFKNYPLDAECNPNLSRTVHAGACWVARGGLCAVDQGKFWPYHDRVFGAAPPTNPTSADVVRLGQEAGLDPVALESCLASGNTTERLAREIAEAAKAGVQATPSVYINGKKLPRINDFVAMVDKEAARLGLPPTPPPSVGH
jgi:protein-disulfide isomerase/uncharacterized membrane protein